ncbi:MAG TPA: hypothetical protein VF338_05065 [Leptolinea sp.]
MTTSFQKFSKIVLITAGIILCCLSVYSSLNTYKVAKAAVGDGSSDDMVTAWDKRLRKIRPMLPEYGVIGYVADWDIPGSVFGSSDQEVEFLLSQYTVAPVVLERGTDHDLILGNFSDNGDPTKLENVQQKLGISVLQPYSNEIFLFKKGEK